MKLYLFTLSCISIMFSTVASAQQNAESLPESQMAVNDSLSLISSGDTVSTGIKYLEFEDGGIGAGHLVRWKRQGWWTFLRADSTKESQMEYDNGIPLEERVFDLQGNLLADYLVPDTEPKFYGGEMVWGYYVNRKLTENKKRLRDVHGENRVGVGFVVEKNGAISHVSVLVKSGTALDSVAIEIVKNSPAWYPASTGEVHVAAYCKRYFTITNLSTVNNDSLFLARAGDTASSGIKFFKYPDGKVSSGMLRYWIRDGWWTTYSYDYVKELRRWDTLKAQETKYDLGKPLDEKVFDEKGKMIADYAIPDSSAKFSSKIGNWPTFVRAKIRPWENVIFDRDGGGTVDVGFMIEIDGTVDKVCLVNGSGTILDKVVLDVISKSPRWYPAIIDHHPAAEYQVWQVLWGAYWGKVMRAPAYVPPVK